MFREKRLVVIVLREIRGRICSRENDKERFKYCF